MEAQLEVPGGETRQGTVGVDLSYCSVFLLQDEWVWERGLTELGYSVMRHG